MARPPLSGIVAALAIGAPALRIRGLYLAVTTLAFAVAARSWIFTRDAKPGATVSAPVTWDEVERGFEIADFTIETMPGRIDEVGDLWREFFKRRQSLPMGTA